VCFEDERSQLYLRGRESKVYLNLCDVCTRAGYHRDNNLQISEMAMTGESDMMYKGEYEFSGNNV
jgi:hypothetical protein